MCIRDRLMKMEMHVHQLLAILLSFTQKILKMCIRDRKRNFIQRYRDGIEYAYNASKEWKKHIHEIDAVILQSTPTAFFSVILLKRYLKKPIIYNNFDVFPDGPYL